MKTKERHNANLSLVFTLSGVIAAAAPFITGGDIAEWGGASLTGGVIMSVTAFITFLMFNGRAKVMSRIFSGDNVLVRWQYSEAFWEENIQNEMKDSGTMKIMGAVLGGIFAVTGAGFFIADPDDNGLTALIMLGLGGFFLILGFVSAAVDRRRLRRSPPEAVIARDGVFYQGALYIWNQPSIAYLEGVSVNPADPSRLLIVVAQLAGRYAQYQQHFINIPIPPGQEQIANDVADYFDKPLSPDLEKKITGIKEQAIY